MVRPRAGVSAPQHAAALFQGRVVQLDRASAFEAEGCRFEPCRAHLLMHSSDEPVAPQEKRYEGGDEGGDHQEQPHCGPPLARHCLLMIAPPDVMLVRLLQTDGLNASLRTVTISPSATERISLTPVPSWHSSMSREGTLQVLLLRPFPGRVTPFRTHDASGRGARSRAPAVSRSRGSVPIVWTVV